MVGWISNNTIYGELVNGIKVVITDVVPNDATTTAIVIEPLKKVYYYFPSIKDPGDVPVTFEFSMTANTQNSIDINPSGDATGAVVSIMSFGV